MSTKRREAYSYDHPINTPVVAIDVGTSKSAMGQTRVGIEGLQQDLIMPKGCGMVAYGQHKIQTAILLRVKSPTLGRRHITSPSDVEAIAFGDHAETEYFSRIPVEERSGYIFLKWFKLELWMTQPSGTNDPILPNPDGGCTVSLSVALAKTLELFKEGAMEYLQRTKSDIKKEDVVWTLTIPAILEEKAKYLMRTAAFAAGIIDDLNSERLNLCLEPEGVCFAALLDEELIAAPGVTRVGGSIGGMVTASASSAATKVSEDCTQLATMLKTVDSKFVVFDAGGGTIDIAAYEIVSATPFQVKQIATPVGGEYGGTQVDKQFMILLRDIIGEEPYKALTDRYRHVELEIRRAWETVKVSAKRDPTEAVPGVIQLASLQQEVLVPLGLKLADLIDSYRANRLSAGVSSQLCPEARGETRMVLPTDLIASLFEPSISKTIECLDKYLTTTRAAEATHLLMAGGYSACPFLRHAVSQYALQVGWSQPMQLHYVLKADTAIVRGAAIYGTAHRDKVVSRIAKYTFGEYVYGITYNPNEPTHTARDDQVRADEYGLQTLPQFLVHVKKGAEIPSGFRGRKQLCMPLTATQTWCQHRFLQTDHAIVVFPDEPGVTEIAKYSTPVDMTVSYDQRISITEFEFGGTEIKCRVFDKNEAMVGHAVAKYT